MPPGQCARDMELDWALKGHGSAELRNVNWICRVVLPSQHLSRLEVQASRSPQVRLPAVPPNLPGKRPWPSGATRPGD
eukprot:355574-Hanusia_phi.AAC.1